MSLPATWATSDTYHGESPVTIGQAVSEITQTLDKTHNLTTFNFINITTSITKDY